MAAKKTATASRQVSLPQKPIPKTFQRSFGVRPEPEEEEPEEEESAAEEASEDGVNLRRLVSYSTLRKIPELKGLRITNPEFKKIALKYIERWFDEYKPNSTEVEIDSAVVESVYAVFDKIKAHVPANRKLILMRVYKELDDESWDDRMTQLEAQINEVLSHDDFTTIRGPNGGTAWNGQRTQ